MLIIHRFSRLFVVACLSLHVSSDVLRVHRTCHIISSFRLQRHYKISNLYKTLIQALLLIDAIQQLTISYTSFTLPSPSFLHGLESTISIVIYIQTSLFTIASYSDTMAIMSPAKNGEMQVGLTVLHSDSKAEEHPAERLGCNS